MVIHVHHHQEMIVTVVKDVEVDLEIDPGIGDVHDDHVQDHIHVQEGIDQDRGRGREKEIVKERKIRKKRRKEKNGVCHQLKRII